ncbi:MAG: hypothetical protein QNJ51_23530 [Calothrix sp. MO_167.B12]|nr:hypothetical protein [Calothrix sp. MO_167.B12]
MQSMQATISCFASVGNRPTILGWFLGIIIHHTQEIGWQKQQV